MPSSGRTNRLGIVGDVSMQILPSSALLDNLTISKSLTINTIPYPSSTPTTGITSVLASIDGFGDTKWEDANDTVSNITYRLDIDPQSNPDMTIGGLVIDAASTIPGPFNIPLASGDQPLDVGAPFVNDPFNSFTLNTTANVGITSITCNRAGTYQFTLSMPLLAVGSSASNAIIQLLRTGQPIFSGPPIMSAIGSVNIPLAGFGAMSSLSANYNMLPFDYASNFTCTSPVELVVGDQLSLVIALDTGSVIVPLTSNLSIYGK